MPKEVLQPKKLGQEDASVVVGWSKRNDAGYVQLATLNRPLTKDDTIADVTGMYLDLTRDDINALIRNLRRARDQAFGTDE